MQTIPASTSKPFAEDLPEVLQTSTSQAAELFWKKVAERKTTKAEMKRALRRVGTGLAVHLTGMRKRKFCHQVGRARAVSAHAAAEICECLPAQGRRSCSPAVSEVSTSVPSQWHSFWASSSRKAVEVARRHWRVHRWPV